MSELPDLQPLADRLRRSYRLEEADVALLAGLPVRQHRFPMNFLLVAEGQLTDECSFLIDGHAYRFKAAANGGRQILSFHGPGDILGLHHLFFERSDQNVQTVVESKVAFVPIPALREALSVSPSLAAAFWRESMIDASMLRERALNVGRRDATTRVAHLLCELAVRQGGVRGVEVSSFRLSLTQELIADATGLTPVHVNRTLRALSEEGVITRAGRIVTINDWQRMRRVADFDEAYLHMPQR